MLLLICFTLVPARASSADPIRCDPHERVLAAEADAAWLIAEARRIQAQALAKWSVLEPQMEGCLLSANARTRRRCSLELGAFISRTRRLVVQQLPRALRAEFPCDPSLSRARTTFPIEIPDLGYAEFLLQKLRTHPPGQGLSHGAAIPSDAVAAIRADYRAASSLAVREERLRSIAHLKAMLSSTMEASRSDVVTRLAELYFDEGQMLAMEAYLHCQQPDGCSNAASDQSSIEFLERSVKLLSSLNSSGGAASRQSDRGTFLLSLGHLVLGQGDQASAELTLLVEKHPDHHYMSQAYLLLGDLRSAPPWTYEAFLSLAEFSDNGEGSRLSFALYRRALTHLAKGDLARATPILRAAALSADRARAYEVAIAANAILARDRR